MDEPGEGSSSKQQQDRSLTGREVYQRYGEQHRDEDGQPNRHHQDVSRQVCIVTKQQLRVHMSVEGEVAKQRRNEVNQEAEADADIGNILHPGLGRTVQFAVDWQDGRVAQEGKGHGGDGEGALSGDDEKSG